MRTCLLDIPACLALPVTFIKDIRKGLGISKIEAELDKTFTSHVSSVGENIQEVTVFA